jgi:hypothetical protein
MKIRTPHTSELDVFPVVRRGESVTFIRTDEKYPQWFLGVAPDGVRGFFPRQWFEPMNTGEKLVALRDYDATELDVREGADAEILEAYGGWVLARVEGRTGWIPATVLDCSPSD